MDVDVLDGDLLLALARQTGRGMVIGSRDASMIDHRGPTLESEKTAVLGCRCGRVRGTVTRAAPASVNRVICYCDDCQAFAHWLARADLLDAHGGTDIVQLAPASM